MAVVFFDFDSTVVTKETLDDTIARSLASHPDQKRVIAEIEDITRLGMEGKLDFLESVRRRVSTAALTKTLLERTGEDMLHDITPGMPEIFAWLKANSHEAHIASGGFLECIALVARMLDVPSENIHTNRFLFDASGRVVGYDETSPLWTNDGKTPLLRSVRSRYPGEKFMIVGDGMNDYRAYESGAADIFIGFGANVVRKPVQAKAPHFVMSAPELIPLFEELL